MKNPLIIQRAGETVGDFFSLFYPKACFACGESLLKTEEVLCTSCVFGLPKTHFQDYEDNPLEQLFWGRFPFESATALYFFAKKGTVQHLIHQLKYGGHKEIGVYLGKLLGQELKASARFSTLDLIVPVPLHPKRLHERGYNQSEQIASGLSQSLDIPVDTTSFVRAFATKTQTKKTREERWDNVSEKFLVTTPEALAGKHLLLVDDVITTGATLDACVQTLSRIDGVKISIAALGFASR